MKYILYIFLFISVLEACLDDKTNKNVKDGVTSKVRDTIQQRNNRANNSDTIHKYKLVYYASRNLPDTLLKFKSNIDDSVYAVKPKDIKLVKKLDFSHYELKKMFITVTKEGVKKGVNFAGHYCFISWGCGSPCQLSAVVDMETGVVYNGLSAAMGYQFKKTSKLVIVNPPDSNGWYDKDILYTIPEQYVWTGKKFIRL